ncbi:MAG: DUF1553 domain-containing protein [Acidobacteria bacterium]|nr:DUF1553 domain-containing protein [Acidobacteriota bacterium]
MQHLGLLCLLLSAALLNGSGFEDVAPILKSNCAGCHSGKQQLSGFSIDTFESVVAGGSKHGRAVVGGSPDKSPLMRILRGQLAPQMPLGKSIASSDLQRIEAWIRSMPAPSSEAAIRNWKPFERPVKPELPQVKNAHWVRNPIDQFVLSKIEGAGSKPAPAAERRTLVRRLYFDLIGLPPTSAEMDAFLGNNDPKAYEKLIDKLLADPRYGERWGRHWLDLARYGETSGLEGDGAIGNVWRYRDWVIDAFNNNMPYDRFVLLQLAGGDEHSQSRNNYQPDPQGYIPTAFLRVAPWDRSNLVAAEVRANYLAEVTTATSSIFLGLSIGCARCHDHKYDPIPQKDFYRLQAFFNATQAAGAVPVPYEDEEMAQHAEAQIQKYEALLKTGPEKKELDAFEIELRKKLIAGRISRSEGKALTKQDLYLEAALKPQRIFSLQQVRELARLRRNAERTGDPAEQTALDAYEEPLMAQLKHAYSVGGIDAGKRYEALTVQDARDEARRKYSAKSIFSEEEKNRFATLSSTLDILRRRLERWKANVLAVTNVPGPPSGPDIAPTRVLTRGDYRQPGEVVEAGFPSAISRGFQNASFETDRYRQFPTRGQRITLARWIVSKENPLTARVMVNRIWQQHFGEGIIRTTSDFGKNGDRPSHPELLDWLATEFMDSGWDLRHMHKLMLLSSTFQQAAENPTAKPEDRLFSRYQRRRLEAEAIRDSILYTSGRLNPKMHGPSVFPPLPEDLADFARYGRTGELMWESNESEDDARRRSIYIFQRRSLPLPMMAAFDAIPFSESCDRRSSTTTPLQALSLMNGTLVQREAAQLANRIVEQVGPNRKAQIERAFAVVLNRSAAREESEKFQRAEASLESICRILFSSNEFVYVE